MALTSSRENDGTSLEAAVCSLDIDKWLLQVRTARVSNVYLTGSVPMKPRSCYRILLSSRIFQGLWQSICLFPLLLEVLLQLAPPFSRLIVHAREDSFCHVKARLSFRQALAYMPSCCFHSQCLSVILPCQYGNHLIHLLTCKLGQSLAHLFPRLSATH